MTSPYAQPPHTFQQVVAKWNADEPTYDLMHYYDSLDRNYSFDGTFCYSYEVELDGWRYIVQAHVHVEKNKPNSSGKVFIPGLKGNDIATPRWVVDLSPAYDKTTYPNNSSTDANYRTKLYDGAYRYPTKL
ncbi:hypothetical protein Cs7R123_03480 [Catellatospora sp. TT07R-123]|uniref:hypothetical protein n=1 Tax=Catellatospora sp. TT07R-123 TaxID=2733863 RepID=UPI001B03AD0C|nr:hypothetical protein [Catellatospora sp. TT07R-123]GHJ43006.1 hypothetical protein Cs7R123_03480 [Catellatospora sp. TT07R-123]